MSILNRITTVKWNFDLQVAHKVLQFTSLLFVCSAMDSRELITFLSSSVEENIEITIERTYTKLPFVFSCMQGYLESPHWRRTELQA